MKLFDKRIWTVASELYSPGLDTGSGAIHANSLQWLYVSEKLVQMVVN